jgi:hypothetical protein
VNGFNQAVSLGVTGLPSGATPGFNPSSVTPPANGQASSTLTITTTSGVQTGTFNLSVQGTSGSLNHSATASLIVSSATTNFTITVSPAQTMAPGDTTSYAVTLTSVNGFNGPVTLGASGLASGATATFTPTSVSVSTSGPVSSVLTIGTSTGAQTGTFTVNVTGTGGSGTPGPTSLTLSTSSTPALQLTTFINCAASTSTATYCALPTLPAGFYYDLSTTIAIGHSYVTVTGGGAVVAGTGGTMVSSPPTILTRDPGLTTPMLTVGQNQPQPLTGVVIQNLTFCGNGNLQGQVAGPGCPSLAATTCGASTALNIQQIENSETVTSYTACSDLEVYNVDTGTYPQPFQVSSPATSFYAGPFSLIIANSDFEDSTGNAIEMYAMNDKINDIWIHDTQVNYSAVAGIVIDTNSSADKYGVFEDDRKVCDSWAGSHNYAWADDPSLFRPRNIRIGDHNIFNGNFQGSIAEGGRWVAVRNNTFTNNYITYNTKSSGGTMTFDECADTIQIYGNMMTGPNSTTSDLDQGLELYGRNIYVQNNTIKNYPWAGVSTASPYNLFINDTNQITNNSTNVNSQTGGVLIEDLNAPGCDQVPRDTQGVTISTNTITATTSPQPDGVKFGDRARNTIGGVSISGNMFSSYSQASVFIDNPIVIVNGTINGDPCPGASCATTGNALVGNPPRALTPDAVSSPGQTAQVTHRCPDPGLGSQEEIFTFEAADVGGSQNVQDLEVDLSTLGPPPLGPNTGAEGCHFLYTPYMYQKPYPAAGTFVNMVYLADSSGNEWLAGNPIVIGSAANLSNGYCTIHGATSSYSFTKDPYILNLTLDISFQNMVNGKDAASTLYIYEVVTNRSLQYVSGGTLPTVGGWTYFGWWSQP